MIFNFVGLVCVCFFCVQCGRLSFDVASWCVDALSLLSFGF